MWRIFQRISLRSKFILLCGAFTLPLLYLLFAMTSAYDRDIVFTEQELRGTRALPPLVEAYVAISAYHEVWAKAPSSQSERETARTAVDNSFQEIAAIFEKHGEALRLDTKELAEEKKEHLSWSQLEASWKTLQAAPASEAAGDAHQELLAQLAEIISWIGDSSNLILDPDLDSFYVMDIVLVALPSFLQRIEIIRVSSQSRSTKDPAGSMATEAAVWNAKLKDVDWERMSGAMQKALDADDDFYGNLEGINDAKASLQALEASLEPLIRQLDEMAQSGKPVDLSGAISAIRSQSLSTWKTMNNTLAAMLKKRLDHHQYLKSRAITLSLLLLVGMVSLGIIFARFVTARMVTLVYEVSQEARALASVADTMDDNVRKATETSIKQAAAIEEVVSSMTEISSMIAATVSNAQEALQEARRNSSEAEQGQEVVRGMVHSMQEINQASERLEEMSHIMREIQSKTQIINSIAFETKLLAFNASIEAARAGGHGKGFAVVAEEIAKLAKLSAKASTEIGQLITSSSERVTASLEEIRQKVMHGQSITESCNEVFRDLGRSAYLITGKIDHMTHASKEQESGVRQTHQAMYDMDQATQVNSGHHTSLARQSHHLRQAASTLSRSAITMRSLVLGELIEAPLAPVVTVLPPPQESPQESKQKAS